MASASADTLARDSVVTSPTSDLLVLSRDDERLSTTPTSEATTTASPCTVTLMSPSVFLASHEEMFPCDLVDLINMLNDSDVESGSAAAPSSSSSVARSHEYSSSIANNGKGKSSYWQNQALCSPARRAFWCGDSCRLPDAREISRRLDELNAQYALRVRSMRTR